MWHAKNVSCLWRSRPENTQVRRRERVAASQVSPRCPSPLPSLLRAWSRGALLVAPVAGSVGGCSAAPWSRSTPPRAIPRSALGERRAGGTGHPRRRAARDIPPRAGAPMAAPCSSMDDVEPCNVRGGPFRCRGGGPFACRPGVHTFADPRIPKECRRGVTNPAGLHVEQHVSSIRSVGEITDLASPADQLGSQTVV